MQSTFFTLPQVSTLSPSISLRRKDQLYILVIEHAKFRAAIALQGAHLLTWQPHDQPPVIWLSDKTAFTEGKAIRGGVPICWPWFGAAGNPSHGFARSSLWQLDEHHEDDESAKITLSLCQSESTLALWPHPFTLRMSLSFTAEQCHLDLSVLGNFSSTAALHSYFYVQDIEQVMVNGLGSRFIDKVENNQVGEQHGAQLYRQEVDRIFTQPTPQSIIDDQGLGRKIDVDHQGFSDVVTWNPWQELSASMADMADEGYRTMVCVETARIHQPLVTTDQQAEHIAVTIRPRQ